MALRWRGIATLALVGVVLAACGGAPPSGTPAGQTPTLATTATSGSVNGPLTVTSPDGAFTIDIPAGVSVPSQPTITVLDASSLPFSTPDVPPLVGAAYEVGPDGATFSSPATVRMRLPAVFPKGGLAMLASRSSAGAWELLANQRIETGSGGQELVGTTSHLTTFLTLDSGGVISTDKEMVSGKVGDSFTIFLDLSNTRNRPGFSIKALSATPASGSSVVAHVVNSDLPGTALKGDGTFASFTIQCDNPGTTTLVIEWDIEVLGEWPGTGPEAVIGGYTFKTEVNVTCTEVSAVCVPGPVSNAALIDFSGAITGMYPQLGEAQTFCESIESLGIPDALEDQFTADAQPPGLAKDANDITETYAFKLLGGVDWSQADSQCGTGSGLVMLCGNLARPNEGPVFMTAMVMNGPQGEEDSFSVGEDLILDDDQANNWPAQPELPLQILRGADAVITPQAVGDGTFNPPTFTDLRANTGRQSNAIVLVAPTWIAFITFDPATQVLPWLCQFDNVGQGSEHQACDVPGLAVPSTPFVYLTPPAIPLP